MARPQNSPKGLFRKRQIDVVGSNGDIVALTANSTALLVDKGLRLSGQANAVLTGDSTGVKTNAGLTVGASILTEDSTGLLLGSRYLSTNTTGNSTT